MGRQIMRKRRPVFSLEPNKLVYVIFARNYAKHLLTALAKIKHKKIASNDRQDEHLENLQKIVKFEVDMAMALSATEFAWGHALKEKLQRGPSNYSISKETYAKKEDSTGDGLSLQLVRFSRENCSKPKRKSSSITRRESLQESEEEKKIESGLKNLRMILPGGGDGIEDVDDLLKQTASYMQCLESQVKVLRCLVDMNAN